MNISSKKFLSLFAIAATSAFIFGCADETVLQDPGNASPNSGTISFNNFEVLAEDPSPDVCIDTGCSETEVVITATIGDRRNQTLTDSHIIYFATEWGTIEPSCTTVSGSCSVTWKTSNFDYFPANDGNGWTTSSPGNNIVAYTQGEEGFTDLNGNQRYDDADGNFTDLAEPFIDVNNNDVHDTGEPIIDTVNGNDLTGKNGVHDTGDGFFNGPGCTHTSLCSTINTSPVIWNDITLKLDGDPETP